MANQTVSSRQVVYDEIAALAKNKLKSDLDQTYARANLEQADQLVLQAKNAVEVAEAEFSEAMGFRGKQKFSPSDQPLFKFPDGDVSLLVAKALQIRPEVVALRDQVTGSSQGSGSCEGCEISPG